MKLQGMNVVVTGGAGFIGSWIAQELCHDNDVKVFDNFSTGKKKNVPNGVELINGDIRHEDELNSAIKDVDVVFHQAANVQIPLSIENPIFDSTVNIGGTLNVLEACRKNDVKRMIYASSSAAYGNPERFPTPEDVKLTPLSPYGLSKLSGEVYTRLYSEIYGMETASLRYFNVYGHRQNPDSPYSGVLSIFTKNVNEGRGLTVFGNGRQSRDFVNVRDVVKANVLAATSKNLQGDAYNVGTGTVMTLNDVISIIEKITGKSLDVKYDEKRKGDAVRSQSNISKIKKELGYEPSVTFEDGIKELLL